MQLTQTTESPPITRFEPAKQSDREFQAFASFHNRIRAEQLPEDPPIPVAEYARRVLNATPSMNRSIWVALNSSRTAVVASGGVDYSSNSENGQNANIRIAVLPEFRRRGLAHRLLALITQVAQRDKCRLMFSNTSERTPSGEQFMTGIGASKGLESHIDQLPLAELDLQVVKGWADAGSRRAQSFELLFWSGAYPEEHLKAIAELHGVINQQPRGTLEINDIDFTPDHVRAIESRALSNGALRWSMCAREKRTGKFAGFTQIYWHPNRPALIRQSFTGVFPEYRNKGLGRWLKAAMIEKIMREQPKARFIRTDTANSNTAMARVNSLLGFKPYSSNCTWQVETYRVLNYLANRWDRSQLRELVRETNGCQ